MKALLLAAGLGTRLRPLTEKTPKPLLPIGGKALMEYHLDHLKFHGVKEVLINTHYLAEQIVEFSALYAKNDPELKITLVNEEVLLGSAGTLRTNIDFFKNTEDFFVVYGDNLTDINYTNLLSHHRKHRPIVTIASYPEKHPEQKGIIEIDETGLVKRFIEKPKPGVTNSDLANAGLYVFNKEILTFIEKFDEPFIDFGFHVFPKLLDENHPISVYLMEEKVLDIGNLESYNLAQELLKKMTLS